MGGSGDSGSSSMGEILEVQRFSMALGERKKKNTYEIVDLNFAYVSIFVGPELSHQVYDRCYESYFEVD